LSGSVGAPSLFGLGKVGSCAKRLQEVAWDKERRERRLVEEAIGAVF